jgi:predicted lipid-binding transport protein (Tim44 family)
VPAARPKLVVVAGHAAGAVRQLPDSSLVVRMTRGRAWIAVLGVLLVGIVALNVATLGFAASAGKIDAQIATLEGERSMLESREASRYSTDRVRGEAAQLGLAMPTSEDPRVIESRPDDVATAAARLAAAGG